MRKLFWAVFVVSSLAVAAEPMRAQANAPAPTPAAPSAAAAAPAASTHNSGLSDEQKMKNGQRAVEDMKSSLSSVIKMLSDARAKKDVVRVNCLNEKLTLIKGLLRITQQGMVSLEEASGKQDARASEHEHLKITIADQKVRQLRAEAEECIGELAFRTDEKQEVIVEEPEGLPDDPTKPAGPPDIISRPPLSSAMD